MGAQLDIDDVAAGNALAQQELAELRKDAERYRWLRDNAGAWEVSRDPGEWTKCDTGEKYKPRVYFSAYGTGYGGMKLDEAIDAAMNGANKRYASEAPHNTEKGGKRDKGNEKETRT